jgi:hypothetical protein
MRLEKDYQLSHQRQPGLAAHQIRKVFKSFPNLLVVGYQNDTPVRPRLNHAGGVTADGEVNRLGSRMKKVERPDVHCAARQVYSCRRSGFDSHANLARSQLSVISRQ